MEKFRLNHSTGESVFLVERGIVDRLAGECKKAGFRGKILVITDSRVGELYLERIAGVLRSGGYRVEPLIFPPGERSKTLSSVKKAYDFLAENEYSRSDTIVALGGGVIGDLAGFIASTFKRGMNLVQIPTTLIAQSDAVIGGKTGFNLRQGKNLAGSFYPARLNLIDPDFLSTLSVRDIRAGLAEIIKHAIIADGDFFELLENRPVEVRKPDPELLTGLICRSVRIKVRIVESDPLDRGERMKLNLGHTLAHALECVTGFRKFRHGECVALGISFSAYVAWKKSILTENAFRRIVSLLARYKLPVNFRSIPELKVESLIASMKNDKKFQANGLNFVVPERLGQAKILTGINLNVIEDYLKSFYNEEIKS